jgi:phage tail sheath protein FI
VPVGLFLSAQIVIALISQSASPADKLIECYAEKTTVLRRSTDPVETVSDAIVGLCQTLEAEANDELYQRSVRSVQEATGASLSEATTAASSVRDRAWHEWKSRMRSQVVAALVQSRIERAEKP